MSSQAQDPKGLYRLSPGRHGLPPELVSQNQRERLTAGLIATVAREGYTAVTISQIAAAAGVSRRTFYAHFSSKEECFLATYEFVLSSLHQAVAEVTEEEAEEEIDWPDAVRARLAASLEFFSANPDLVRFCLIAPLRAGEQIAARHREAVTAALAELTRGKPEPPAARTPSRAVEDSLLGGMIFLIIEKVEAGDGESLPEMLPDLLSIFLGPYLGWETAHSLTHC